jgi:small subunit ribosomal protein S14
MARKAAIEKQARRERMVKANWEERQLLKKIILSAKTSEEERQKAVDKLNALPRNSSPVRLRNRCLLTGRARGYLRKFKMSRLCFREIASDGYIPGITKASW